MKFNTALTLLGLTLACLLFHRKNSARYSIPVLLLMLIPVLTVAGWAPMDELFVEDSYTEIGIPGQMSFMTAIGLLFLGGAFIAISLFRLAVLSTGLGFLAFIAGLVRLVGRVYGDVDLGSGALYSTMSWSTTVSIIALAAGILLLRPGNPILIPVFRGRRLGLAILALVVSLGFPFLAGLLFLHLLRIGLISVALGTEALALLSMIGFLAFSYQILRHKFALNRAVRRTYTSAMADRLGYPFLLWDANGTLLETNGAFRSLLGGLRRSIHGSSLLDLIPPESNLKTSLPGVPGLKQTAQVPGHFSGTLWDARQEPMAVILFVREESRRDEVFYSASVRSGKEAELIQASQDQEAFQLFTAGISAGIWEWDIDSGLERWSDSFYQILGYEPGDIPATYDTFLNTLLHPDNRQQVLDAVELHLNSGHRYKLEVRMRTKDGSYKWYETAGFASRDADGGPHRMVGSLVDIDQRKNLESQNASQSEELKRSIRALDNQRNRLLAFSQIVAHNLRSYAGNIKVLIDEYEIEPEPAEQEELWEMLKRSSNNLMQTLDDLSSVVQVQHSIHLSYEAIDLNSLLKKIEGTLHGAFHGVPFQLIRDNHLVRPFHSQPAYLESILYNLISNAIKYRHPDREPEIRITIKEAEEATEDQKRMKILVQDNGLGMDLEKYGDKLFGLYKTFHGNKDARGLGLYLTFQQIESLGGFISVESEVGKGTTFCIDLPMVLEPIMESSP
ncbi:MAG: PAS domain-containing protein [Leptospiraceae bacterium]